MSTYKLDAGGYSSELGYGSCDFVHDQQPCTGDSSRLDSVHTSRWWLNRHSLEQSNALDVEVKLSAPPGDVNGGGKLREHHQLIQEYCTECSKNDSAIIVDMPLKQCCSLCKHNGDSWSKEFEATVNTGLLSNVDFMDFVSCNSLLLEQSKKFSSDIDSHWVGLKKAQPWWQAVDKDEPTSLVSQSTDLLGLQALHPDNISDNHEDIFSQLEEKIINRVTSNVKCAQTHVTSVRSLSKQGVVECLLQESDEIFSTKGGSSDEDLSTSNDLTRAQLLEALCHSQTRAREAEKLAQEACDEKDHVINLFFQQASWLFAYRQWLRLLQLESLCLHIRSKTQLSLFTPPSFVPWVRPKGVTVRKNQHKPARKKPGKQKCHLNRHAIAFAVGLTLAGAGLLFGWTIGWLFPAF